MKWKILVPKDLAVDKHGYTINGRKYARVTRTLGVISKPGLITWWLAVGKQKADEVLKKRQVIGTRVHKFFEELCKGIKPDLSNAIQEEKLDVRLFKNFMDKTKLKPEALEQNLWSNKYSYAGTCDYIGKYITYAAFLVRGHKAKFNKSSLVIGDWKTSRSIYPEYWLQLAAYVQAFYEMTGVKVDGAFIAQFRMGKIKVKEKTYDELMEYFEVYKSVLKVYAWKYKNG